MGRRSERRGARSEAKAKAAKATAIVRQRVVVAARRRRKCAATRAAPSCRRRRTRAARRATAAAATAKQGSRRRRRPARRWAPRRRWPKAKARRCRPRRRIEPATPTAAARARRRVRKPATKAAKKATASAHARALVRSCPPRRPKFDSFDLRFDLATIERFCEAQRVTCVCVCVIANWVLRILVVWPISHRICRPNWRSCAKRFRLALNRPRELFLRRPATPNRRATSKLTKLICELWSTSLFLRSQLRADASRHRRLILCLPMSSNSPVHPQSIVESILNCYWCCFLLFSTTGACPGTRFCSSRKADWNTFGEFVVDAIGARYCISSKSIFMILIY